MKITEYYASILGLNANVKIKKLTPCLSYIEYIENLAEIIVHCEIYTLYIMKKRIAARSNPQDTTCQVDYIFANE